MSPGRNAVSHRDSGPRRARCERGSGDRTRPRILEDGDRPPRMRWLHPGPAEIVELAVADATEECLPFVRGESENCPFAIAAVPDAPRPPRQVGNLDTVTVRIAQRALNPGRTGHRSAGQTSRH